MQPAHAILSRDPLSLDQKTHCSGRASFRETERKGGGKKENKSLSQED